jgi:hypothetical protein
MDMKTISEGVVAVSGVAAIIGGRNYEERE